jgi:fucose permease
MGQEHSRTLVERSRIAATFYAIVFIGISAGASGVLLPAQMTDYQVDKSTIAVIFVTFPIGYIACAAANGPLIGWLGIRLHLIIGSAIILGSVILIAVRPSFVLLVVLEAVLGFGIGALDAGLNTYLSTLAGSASLLNYFHAFFGVGALVGPVVVATMLARGFAWNTFYVLLAILLVPLIVWFGLYPKMVRETVVVAGPRLTVALRSQIVWITAVFLCVYVGLESSVGNWGFSFLTEDRGQGLLAAGWIVSAYWLGLTVGRFILGALAERAGVGIVALSVACIGGVIVSTLLVWVIPTAGVATVGLVALGFFLGPLFPTIIAVMPRLVPADLVATAIGVLVAMSVVGGAAFTWLVGASAQRVGLWVLLPIMLALGGALAGLWWSIARRLRAADSVPAVAVPAEA